MLLNKLQDKISQFLPSKAEGRGDSLVLKWLWIANGSILAGALLVLIIGLLSLLGSNPIADGSQVISGSQDTDNIDQSSDGISKTESPLVAMVRKYSTRFNPPKPKPKPKPKLSPKPKPTPKVAPKPKPVTPPKPAPKPRQIIPAPPFTVEATLMIGADEGLAWIKQPKDKQPNLYAVGEKINQYEIVKIQHGIVELMRETANFTLKVPEPKKINTPIPIPVAAPKQLVPPKKNTPRRSRKRPTRTPTGK